MTHRDGEMIAYRFDGEDGIEAQQHDPNVGAVTWLTKPTVSQVAERVDAIVGAA